MSCKTGLIRNLIFAVPAVLALIAVIVFFVRYDSRQWHKENESYRSLFFSSESGHGHDIELTCIDDQYYVFVPAEYDSQPVVGFRYADSMILDGVEYRAGDKIESRFFSVGLSGPSFFHMIIRERSDVICEGDICFWNAGNVPSLYIDTSSGSMEAVTSSDDHSYMESAKLYCADSDCLYSGRCHIRGRGNTTWRTFPKNPYNVEFDEDVSLLGMRAQAKWSLLANIYDGSEMKNAMALDIARAMNIPAWVEYRYANLYLNGEYAGLYLVTQHVDVSGGNIPIHDLGEENRIINDYDQPPEWDVYYDPGARSIEWFEGDSPSDISGGYLVEFVQYGAPGSGFFTTYHTMGVIESPKYHTYDESVYMLDYLLKIEDLIYNDPSEAYAEYIDLDSWSAMYLLKEFLADEDTDLYSLYAYKDRQSDAFVCGPAWDFDATMGVDRDGKHYESARMRWLKQRAESRRENGADEGWLNELYEGHTGFRQATRSLYVNSFRSILELELNDRLPMIHDLIADSAYMDHIRYPHRMRPVYDEGFDDEYSYMISWLEERLKYYDEYYEKDQ